jgi:hypothetical protein
MHEELIKADGRYVALWQYQLFEPAQMFRI